MQQKILWTSRRTYPFLLALFFICLLSVLTDQALYAQPECVIIIQGQKKPNEGDFIRQSTNILIRGMTAFPGNPKITVLRPRELPNDMDDEPDRDEVSYDNKKALLEALEKAFCNEECKNVVIATIGHGMGNAEETKAPNETAGGIKIGLGQGANDWLTAEEIAAIINKCPKGIKIFSSHCFSGAMVDGIKKHLDDPSIAGVGVSSSPWDTPSYAVNGYYEFIRYFLEDYYAIIGDPNVLEEMRKRAEELKRKMAKTKAERQKEREELEKQIKDKEAELKECQDERDGINDEIKELDKQDNTEKEATDKLNELEKAYEDARDAADEDGLTYKEKKARRATRDAAKKALDDHKDAMKDSGKRFKDLEEEMARELKDLEQAYDDASKAYKEKGLSKAEKKRRKTAKDNAKKARDAQRKAMKELGMKYSTNSSLKKRLDFLDEKLQELEDLRTQEEEQKKQKEELKKKKQEEWRKKNGECIDLEEELRKLREKLKEYVILPDRDPLMEAIIHEAFKSAKAKSKLSVPQEGIAPPVAGVTLPGKPMVTVAVGDLWYTFYKVVDKKGKCWIVGWVANKRGVPIYPIKSESCKADCSEAKFTYNDGKKDHTVVLKRGADGKYTLELDGNSTAHQFVGVVTELKLCDKKLGKIIVRHKPGQDPEVRAVGGTVTDVSYDPPKLKFKVKYRGSDKVHEVTIEYLPHDGKSITVDSKKPYTLAMYQHNSMYDADGVRQGEYAYITRDRSIEGVLWLEQNDTRYPFESITNPDGSYPAVSISTDLGNVQIGDLTAESAEPTWSAPYASGTIQGTNVLTPVVVSAGGELTGTGLGTIASLDWTVETPPGVHDMGSLSGIRILKYTGNDDSPEVIDLPADARTFIDVEVRSRQQYSYHIMGAVQNSNSCECSDRTEFPFYSFPQVVEIGRKRFPTIPVVAGVVAAGVTTIALSDDKTTPVEDLPPTALCQDITIALDNNGSGSVSVGQIDAGSTDDNAITDRSLDRSTFGCHDLGIVTVTLRVFDASSQSASCQSQVQVVDEIPPSVQCEDTSVSLDETGMREVDIGTLATAIDNCNVSIEMQPVFLTCTDIGTQNFSVTVTDQAGNSAWCEVAITTSDDLPPTVECQDLTVSLGPGGTVEVTAQQLVSSAQDNCTPDVTIEATPTTLTCEVTSVHEVTVTATDASGNVGQCTSNVTIEDDEAPTIICSDVTVELDGSGTVIITPDAQATDNCDAAPVISSSPTEVSCSDLGTGDLLITATDASGNTATCSATITVFDASVPTISCQDAMVQIGADGTAQIIPQDLVSGVTDNCTADITLTSSPTLLLCENIGLNDVTITASDASGNTATCISIVDLKDTIAPVADCQDLTLSVEPSGTVVLDGAEIAASSSDNCSITSYVIEPSQLTSEDIGENVVSVSITDPSGNTSICEATITLVEGSCDLTISEDIQPTYCGLATGRVEIFVEEPGNYLIEWSNGELGTAITGLAAGTYTATITDLDIGCTQTFDVTIPEIPYEYLSLEGVQPGDCVMPALINLVATSPGDGPIIIQVTSPEGTYMLEAENGQTLILEALLPGIYNLSAWDQTAGPACASFLDVEPIFNFEVITIEAAAQEGVLFGTVITPYPGHVPFTFLMNGEFLGTSPSPDFFFPISTTEPFLLQVIDAFGCTSPEILIIPGIGKPLGIEVQIGDSQRPDLVPQTLTDVEKAFWRVEGLAEIPIRSKGVSLAIGLNDQVDLTTSLHTGHGIGQLTMQNGSKTIKSSGSLDLVTLGTGIRYRPTRTGPFFLYGQLAYQSATLHIPDPGLTGTDASWTGQFGLGLQLRVGGKLFIDTRIPLNLSSEVLGKGLQLGFRFMPSGQNATH